jgi:class 3 adenylate cyclase
VVCKRCGQENPAGARFCLACGAALDAEPAKQERKLVSVLFVDLVGFTGQSEQADPEDVRDTLRAYQVAAQQTIEAFGGTMEKFIGDAVMAVAWRSEAGVTSPQAELLRALRSVLGRENAHTRG